MTKLLKKIKPGVSINTGKTVLHNQKRAKTAPTSQLPIFVFQLLASLAPGLQCVGDLLVELLLFLSEALNLLFQICRSNL